MDRFTHHKNIDMGHFSSTCTKPHARYGLPEKVEFCVRCGVSNQRPRAADSEYALVTESHKPSMHLDEERVCDACRFWEAKNETIDWDEREKQLRELCDRYRRTDGWYDCLVPGSGGKDRFMQSHLPKKQVCHTSLDGHLGLAVGASQSAKMVRQWIRQHPAHAEWSCAEAAYKAVHGKFVSSVSSVHHWSEKHCAAHEH